MRSIPAICGLAFVAAVAAMGCTTDEPTGGTGSSDGSAMPTRDEDMMPTDDGMDMGMGGMGMPARLHASCEANGGACTTPARCAASGARMISGLCAASMSCCVSD